MPYRDVRKWCHRCRAEATHRGESFRPRGRARSNPTFALLEWAFDRLFNPWQCLRWARARWW